MDTKAFRVIQVLIIPITVISILITFSGLSNEIKLRSIRNNGIVVDAIVLDCGKLEQDHGIKTHFLNVEYLKKDSEKVIKAFLNHKETSHFSFLVSHALYRPSL